MTGDTSVRRFRSGFELVNAVLDIELTKPDMYDPEVVALCRKHLGSRNVHSKAGQRFAEDLLELAEKRAKEAGSCPGE